MKDDCAICFNEYEITNKCEFAMEKKITKPAQFASIGSRKIFNYKLRKNNCSDTLIAQKVSFCGLKN